MPRQKKDPNLTLKENTWSETVQVIYFQGYTRDYYRPPEPIHSYISVSFDPHPYRNAPNGEYHYRLQAYESDPLANWHSREDAVRYTSEDAISQAEALIQKIRRTKDRIRKAGRKTPQYKAIADAAKGYLIHFTADLTEHDAYLLGLEQPDIFTWSVRESGTWIRTPQYPSDREWREATYKQRPRDERYYLYKHGKLTPITAEQFRDITFEKPTPTETTHSPAMETPYTYHAMTQASPLQPALID